MRCPREGRRESRPVVVADVDRTESFYHAAGFITLVRVPGPDGSPALIHLRRLRYQDLPIVHGEDLDALAERLNSARSGAASVSGPENTAWFSTNLYIADPDGYSIVFTRQGQDDVAQVKEWAESFEMPQG